MSPAIALIVVAVVLAAVLAAAAAWMYQTANRLNRLHVRCDLSWQALDAALARRAVVARAVAVEAYAGDAAGRRLTRLTDLANRAERAPRPARENAENALSAELAIIDPAALPIAIVAELTDAETRVLLARRFHNDAVRDTLALRERPLVRLLRLGGTAPVPTYFEIVERGNMMPDGAPGVRRPRVSARTVLLDTTGAVLLLCGSDPALADRADAPRWWFTVGGKVRPGEQLNEAAARELDEETGLRVEPAALIGPIWRRDAVFEFNGEQLDSQEFFFVHRTRRFEPVATGRTSLERRYLHDHRWCTAADMAELAEAGQTVYPLQLGELLDEANRLADDAAADPPRLRSIR